MGKKPDRALGWMLIALMVFVVALGPVLMVASRGWAYTALYIIVLAGILGAMLLGVVAFVRLGAWLGEWALFVLATLAVPGSFALLVLLPRWELNEGWWAKPLAMIIVFVPIATWFVVVQRLGADAPPMRRDGRETYRIAIGWRILAWVGGIGFAGAPLAAWLQEGGWWWLVMGLVWLAVGSLVVRCMHIRRVIVERNMIRANDCHGIWTERPLDELRGIAAPAKIDREFLPLILQFDRGPDLSIPGTLAGRERLIAELRARLSEQPQNA